MFDECISPKMPSTMYLFCTVLLNVYKPNTPGSDMSAWFVQCYLYKQEQICLCLGMEIVSQSALSLRTALLLHASRPYRIHPWFSQIASSQPFRRFQHRWTEAIVSVIYNRVCATAVPRRLWSPKISWETVYRCSGESSRSTYKVSGCWILFYGLECCLC